MVMKGRVLEKHLKDLDARYLGYFPNIIRGMLSELPS
jgi:hypothetical protein